MQVIFNGPVLPDSAVKNARPFFQTADVVRCFVVRFSTSVSPTADDDDALQSRPFFAEALGCFVHPTTSANHPPMRFVALRTLIQRSLLLGDLFGGGQQGRLVGLQADDVVVACFNNAFNRFFWQCNASIVKTTPCKPSSWIKSRTTTISLSFFE